VADDHRRTDFDALAEWSTEDLHAELLALGLRLPNSANRAELIDQLMSRREWIERIDRTLLSELSVWSNLKLSSEASNEAIVRQLLARSGGELKELSDGALALLARLRGIVLRPQMDREEIERRLDPWQGIRQAWRRRRRRFIGSLVSRAFGDSAAKERSVPVDASEASVDASVESSIRRQIEERGVVGGIANKLRGAADDYIAAKLDEIELRIDLKLDEVDRRLAEWRDQEISNRLRILKLTLIFAIVVASISLGYDYLRTRVSWVGQPAAAQQAPPTPDALDETPAAP
jgi:hypothetical protein